MSDNVVDLNRIDPSKFRIPASDAKGHSVPRSLRMQPIMWSAIKNIINSRKFPYSDASDFMRHAIVRHMKWLETIGDIPCYTKQVDAANEILREDQENEEYQELFVSLRKRINDYLSRNHRQQARVLVSRMHSHFEGMPEGYWREQYRSQLAEYDHLFEDAPTIRLTQIPKK